MAMYLVLSRWTDQGLRNVKEAPARIDQFRKQIKAMGGELRDFYVSMGRYDTISLVNAPNDEAVGKIALALGALGNVHTETLRLFSEEEFKKLVQS
jgi:uncharacterized protein with GYD domain